MRVQKSQFCHTEKFLMVYRSGFFPDGLLTPKGHFGAIRANLKMVFLRKIHFFAYPIWAQNGLFFYPGGPHLTQNIKNIVLQVVLTQNIAFQGLNWSPNTNGNFGVGRPPQTPPGPPRPPQGSGGTQNHCNALVPVQC